MFSYTRVNSDFPDIHSPFKDSHEYADISRPVIDDWKKGGMISFNIYGSLTPDFCFLLLVKDAEFYYRRKIRSNVQRNDSRIAFANSHRTTYNTYDDYPIGRWGGLKKKKIDNSPNLPAELFASSGCREIC